MGNHHKTLTLGQKALCILTGVMATLLYSVVVRRYVPLTLATFFVSCVGAACTLEIGFRAACAFLGEKP
jgi:biotin transporter BioY